MSLAAQCGALPRRFIEGVGTVTGRRRALDQLVKCDSFLEDAVQQRFEVVEEVSQWKAEPDFGRRLLAGVKSPWYATPFCYSEPDSARLITVGDRTVQTSDGCDD